MLNQNHIAMKTKQRIISGMVIMLLLIAGTGCRQSMTEKSLNYGDNLKNAISDYEHSRQKFSQEVNESISSTNKKLEKEDPKLSEVAHDWEKRWDEVHKSFNRLQENFSEVGKSSQKYFEKLQELSSGIENDSLRRAELSKNRRLKEKWTNAYEEASKNFDKIRKVLKEGNDYQRVLVASSVRQKIEKNIAELDKISIKANKILKELKTFTIEGKKLIA